MTTSTLIHLWHLTSSGAPIILGPTESGSLKLSEFFAVDTADDELQIGAEEA